MRLHEDRLDDHLTDDEVRERFAAIDRATAIAGIGHWQTDTPVIADPLGAGGAETFAKHDPSLGSMLIPFMVLFAFAVGWFLAYASH